MRSRVQLTIGFVAMCALVLAACATTTTDTGVTAKVKSKMAEDPAVKAYQIEVVTNGHVVTLTGNIDSQEAKDRALELARNTEGVTSVVDMIAVKTSAAEGNAPDPHRTLGEKIDDAGITMSVKAKLLSDPDVKGLRIDVDTRDGVVYLTGKVGSQAEADKAIQRAKEAEGVKDVQANLTIEKG